jgi:ribonuclease VapC
MIVVDTSILVAILKQEPGFDEMSWRIVSEPEIVVPAVVVVEAYTVAKALGYEPEDIDEIIDMANARVEPFTPEDIAFALDALRRFAGRPAGLTFVDRLVYATARRLNAPLYFVGNDFAATDVIRASSF